jgi:hypothetical protein
MSLPQKKRKTLKFIITSLQTSLHFRCLYNLETPLRPPIPGLHHKWPLSQLPWFISLNKKTTLWTKLIKSSNWFAERWASTKKILLKKTATINNFLRANKAFNILQINRIIRRIPKNSKKKRREIILRPLLKAIEK